MQAAQGVRKIVMDPFCFKQFDTARATAIAINMDKDAFTERVNNHYLTM